ncbi:MAG: hypothetical protein LBF22_04625 [Deltaproteobacteria bacterium]|jgi:flagellar biosynthesis/type III secretory pathway protein FliH|nr:hypothetical protein [Deltaproteobacteria bacterium]
MLTLETLEEWEDLEKEKIMQNITHEYINQGFEKGFEKGIEKSIEKGIIKGRTEYREKVQEEVRKKTSIERALAFIDDGFEDRNKLLNLFEITEEVLEAVLKARKK